MVNHQSNGVENNGGKKNVCIFRKNMLFESGQKQNYKQKDTF